MTSVSMAARKAASVFPEPVGAAISTLRCARISGQARACAGVGAGNWPANQAATAGWNEWGMGYFLTSRQSGNRRAATRLIRWLIRGRCANLDCCFPRQTAFATDEACTASAADDAADGYFCRPAARATVQLFAARRRRQAGAGGARRAYRRRAVGTMPRRSQEQEDHGGDRRATVERIRRGAAAELRRALPGDQQAAAGTRPAHLHAGGNQAPDRASRD